jgi:hypothetical protein
VIEVRVSDDFMIDGLAIYIARRQPASPRLILRLREDGTHGWEQVEPQDTTEPTLKLGGEEARALLEALLRHYQGASDMHTMRSDLLHERERVDKLTGAVIAIATHEPPAAP